MTTFLAKQIMRFRTVTLLFQALEMFQVGSQLGEIWLSSEDRQGLEKRSEHFLLNWTLMITDIDQGFDPYSLDCILESFDSAL